MNSPRSRQQAVQDFISNHISHLIMGGLLIFVIAHISLPASPSQTTSSNEPVSRPLVTPIGSQSDVDTDITPTAISSPITRRYLPISGHTIDLPSASSVTQIRWSPSQNFIALQNSTTGVAIWNVVQNNYFVSKMSIYSQFDWSTNSHFLYVNRYIASIPPQSPMLSFIRTFLFGYMPALRQPILLKQGVPQRLVTSSGNNIALLSADGLSFALFDPEPPRGLLTHTLDNPAHDLDWIDDSRWISVVTDTDILKWSAESGPYSLHKGHYQQVSWSPDHQAYAATQDLLQDGSHDPTLTIFITPVDDSESDQKWSQPLVQSMWSVKDITDFNVQVAWSPDGKRIATFVQRDIVLDLWDAETGTHLTRFYSKSPINCIDWSPDSLYLAIGSSSAATIWSPA